MKIPFIRGDPARLCWVMCIDLFTAPDNITQRHVSIMPEIWQEGEIYWLLDMSAGRVTIEVAAPGQRLAVMADLTEIELMQRPSQLGRHQSAKAQAARAGSAASVMSVMARTTIFTAAS